MYRFTRKKSLFYIFCLIGIIIFILFNSKTDKQLYRIPMILKLSNSTNLINIHRIENILLTNVSFYEKDKYKCNDENSSLNRKISYRIHYNDILNYVSFIIRSHSLFYCSVPKVATRTLLKLITYVYIRDELIPLLKNSTLNFYSKSNLKLFNIDYFKQIIPPSVKNNSISILELFLSNLILINETYSSKIDLWSMYQNQVLPFIRLRTLSDPLKIFSSNFTRVIFVRHPLERLASAYIDKISSLNNVPFSLYDNLRRSICRKYSSFYLTKTEQMFYNIHRKLSKQIDEPCQKIIPNFEHFIDYIMSDTLQNDVHWQPYSKLCHVCLFKYNFIGKYETIKEDLKRLILYLRLEPNYWNNEYYITNSKTKKYYQLMYSNLTNRLICNLKFFYQDDFNLFNYRLEDYLINQTIIQCSSIHKPFIKNYFFKKRRHFF